MFNDNASKKLKKTKIIDLVTGPFPRFSSPLSPRHWFQPRPYP